MTPLSYRVVLIDDYNKRERATVYDRFFTRLEQRVSRAEIESLTDTFARVTISPHIPYWHFLCEGLTAAE